MTGEKWKVHGRRDLGGIRAGWRARPARHPGNIANILFELIHMNDMYTYEHTHVYMYVHIYIYIPCVYIYISIYIYIVSFISLSLSLYIYIYMMHRLSYVLVAGQAPRQPVAS